MTKRFRPKRVLSTFVLAMINVAIIVSLRGLPMLAEYGFASLIFYAIAAVGFLIPVGLVSAELATGWPETGGVFIWVSKAFGPRVGFIAVFLQWIQNVIWYPTVLSFTAATISYIFNPALASNRYYNLIMILFIYWGATLLNFRGMKVSGFVSTFCVIIGTLVPGAVIIVLGILWFISGNPMQITFTWDTLFPNFTNFGNIVFLAGVFLLFSGMEVSAVHAKEVKDPQKNYPKAILLSTLIILAVFILGSLAIAIVVPQKDISLVAGLLQAFSSLFESYHLSFLTPIIAVMIAIGALGQVTSWIVGPSKGLFATAREGFLPKYLTHVNNHQVPTHLLSIQGCIVTLLSLIFLFMPTVSSSYWLLSALTINLYLIMYLIIYVAAVYLRYKHPEVKRPYKVPGGKWGIWLVSGVGILCALFAFFIGLLPPTAIQSESLTFHLSFLLIGIFVVICIPLIIFEMQKKR